MRYMIKLCILCLVIISSSYKTYTQDFESVIKFADEQFRNKNYQSAVKEYQRALFFSNGRQQDYLYKQIASAFFVNDQFEQAQYFFDLSYKTAKNDSLKNDLLIKKVQCYLRLKQYTKALVELYNFPEDLSKYFDYRKKFYSAITYFAMENFRQSEQYFLAIANDEDTKKEINKLFTKRMLHRPNPKTAKILSICVPGMGQMYAGDIKNSLNSIALTGGFAYLGIYLGTHYSYLDAIMTSAPWFLRYYQGGYNHAYKIAVKKRQKRRNQTYEKLINIISNEPVNQ